MLVSRTQLLCALVLLTLAGVSPAEPSAEPHDGKVYIITNVHSGKRLAIEGGSREPHGRVVQDDSTKTHVTWTLEKFSKGYFRLVNTSSGLSLDVTDGSGDPVQLQQWHANDTDAQAWEFIKKGEHYYIRNKGSKLVMDVANASKDHGGAVGQWPEKDEGKGNQLWTLIEVKK
jgi:hypothetical protein